MSQIEVNSAIPAEQTLMEYTVAPSEQACALKPTPVDVTKSLANRNIAIVAVPGAFTPTCSERHIPPYIARTGELKVDETWVISVNDPFVMAYWGRQLNVESAPSVRFLADGDATFVKALGLEKDCGSMMGVRSQRWSMVVTDGVVAYLNVEAPGKFEVSDVDTMIKQLNN